MEKELEAVYKLIQNSPEVSRFITGLTDDKRQALLNAARSAMGGNREGMAELMSALMNSQGGMSLASMIMEAFGKNSQKS